MTAKQHGSLSAAAATLKYEYVFLQEVSFRCCLACYLLLIGILQRRHLLDQAKFHTYTKNGSLYQPRSPA